jgi:hypothetical protein
MSLSRAAKTDMLDWIISTLKENFDVTTVGAHAAAFRESTGTAHHTRPAIS